MTIPRLAGLVARTARREADRRIRPPDAATRARGVDVVQQALRQRGRRRLLARGLCAALAAAAVVLAVVGLTRDLAPSPVASPSNAPGPDLSYDVRLVAEGKPVLVGERVSATAGGVELDLSTGTTIRLDARTDLDVQSTGPLEAFDLVRGALGAHVAKLGPAERFIVHTPDAEIEVRGTRFRVSVVASDPLCGGGTVTRVDVTEGVVAVRHQGQETRVVAGESWPDACSAAAPPSSAPSQPAAVHPPGAAHAPSAGPSPSTLAEQNALFTKGLAAKQRGDAAAAIADFEALLATYPEGPLAEDAAAERMRLLNATDPRRGVEAAREYLRRYPNGLVRAEAQAIAGQGP